MDGVPGRAMIMEAEAFPLAVRSGGSFLEADTPKAGAAGSYSNFFAQIDSHSREAPQPSSSTQTNTLPLSPLFCSPSKSYSDAISATATFTQSLKNFFAIDQHQYQYQQHHHHQLDQHQDQHQLDEHLDEHHHHHHQQHQDHHRYHQDHHQDQHQHNLVKLNCPRVAAAAFSPLQHADFLTCQPGNLLARLKASTSAHHSEMALTQRPINSRSHLLFNALPPVKTSKSSAPLRASLGNPIEESVLDLGSPYSSLLSAHVAIPNQDATPVGRVLDLSCNATAFGTIGLCKLQGAPRSDATREAKKHLMKTINERSDSEPPTCSYDDAHHLTHESEVQVKDSFTPLSRSHHHYQALHHHLAHESEVHHPEVNALDVSFPSASRDGAVSNESGCVAVAVPRKRQRARSGYESDDSQISELEEEEEEDLVYEEEEEPEEEEEEDEEEGEEGEGEEELLPSSEHEKVKGSSSKKKKKMSLSLPKGGSKMMCLNCRTTATPQWREGPEGTRTLCNACGLRYRKGLPLPYWDK